MRRYSYIVVLVSLCSLGCSSPRYVLQQSWGQAKILAKRKTITDALHNDHLAPDAQRKLRLVLRARAYGAEKIGLKTSGAYRYFYDTKGKPVAWALSAAPKDRLQPIVWTFPVVGAVPYLGFFRRSDALAQQQHLLTEKLDTYLRPVAAFSSLGWFDDPLFSSLLDEPAWRIVEVVLHETTHTTIFLRGAVGFNESLAVFVGQQGTLNMLARRYGPNAPIVKAAQAAFRRRSRFSAFIEQLYTRLSQLYAKPLARKAKIAARQKIFRWAKQRYMKLLHATAEADFVRRPLNNAIVLSYGRYLKGLRFHQKVYSCVGKRLSRMVALYRFAQQMPHPIAFVAHRCGLNHMLETVDR